MAIFKLMPLKINRFLPIYISTLPLRFGVDIQSHIKVGVRKQKNPIWPPVGHYEINVAENHAAYRVQKPKNQIWPPGDHFEHDVAENE